MKREPSLKERQEAEAKAAKKPKPDPDQFEHPEDRAARLEGEKYGREHASEFCEQHQADLRSLIATYSDGAALAVFERLREAFWAQIWKPTPAAPEPKDEARRGR